MAWKRMKGLTGLMYVPDESLGREKKHNCPDCDMCQWCGDTRCDECLKRKTCRKMKMRTKGKRR